MSMTLCAPKASLQVLTGTSMRAEAGIGKEPIPLDTTPKATAFPSSETIWPVYPQIIPCG